MTLVDAALVGLLAGVVLGWLARATLGPYSLPADGANVRPYVRPERLTAPPKVSSPKPPPSAGQGYNPPPVECVMRPTPTPAPPYPYPSKPWPAPPSSTE